ncbi:MAG: multiheme c-type cytochrome [Candidatus Eisenbacteria bacterium]
MQETPYILHLDGGSFVTRRSYESQLIDAMNARGLMEMGCAATTIGAFDLFRGGEYLKGLIADHGLPVVSANVYDESTGELFVEPYVIVERAGVKFGITGALDPGADIRTHNSVEQLGVIIGEPMETLPAVLEELNKKADYVILLSQLGLEQSKLLAEEIPGIDFMVLGSEAQYAAEPFEVGSTVVLQSGYKGQRLSDCRLQFDEANVYLGYSGTTLELGDKVPSDAAMALLLKEHKIAIEDATKRRAAANRSAAKPSESLYREECLGAEATCGRCHKPQMDQWAETAHARAFATLENAHQATNPECLRCHTTCYLDMPLDGSVSVANALKDVQCESCHGKATEHARDGSYGSVTASTCGRCHDKENSPNFDFAEYLPKVTH